MLLKHGCFFNVLWATFASKPVISNAKHQNHKRALVSKYTNLNINKCLSRDEVDFEARKFLQIMPLKLSVCVIGLTVKYYQACVFNVFPKMIQKRRTSQSAAKNWFLTTTRLVQCVTGLQRAQRLTDWNERDKPSTRPSEERCAVISEPFLGCIWKNFICKY